MEISADRLPGRDESLALYESVGWTAYTRDVETLEHALRGSHLVLTARDDQGELVGLARTVSDGTVICYLQDLLVQRSRQGQGIGRALMERVLAEYPTCRQVVLMTDADGPAEFYRSLGFQAMAEYDLVGYALMR
jgi:ribosomal protein S18 acetylase RimI-like enzyme